jgi:predicted nucleotidyltransferase
MKTLLKHIAIRLTMFFLITAAFVSFENLTDYTISDIVFSESTSLIDSEKMEEVQSENELNIDQVLEFYNIEENQFLVVSIFHSRYLTIKSLFITEDVSPPPEFLFA